MAVPPYAYGLNKYIDLVDHAGCDLRVGCASLCVWVKYIDLVGHARGDMRVGCAPYAPLCVWVEYIDLVNHARAGVPGVRLR